MNTIEVSHLTKDYGQQRGVFNVDLVVKQGEVYGFLGPNGAGKTTTIRHLMGFIKPEQGSCKINGLDCWSEASLVQKDLGYLPGEIAFMDDMTGDQFIRFIAEIKGIKDLTLTHHLIQRFQLNPHSKIKKMSKGMKQKIGIVCAFMGDPSVIVLDEPTSGLDPLMQNIFVEWIKEQKQLGKTIFMSSHMFEEVEKTCDRVAMIKNGQLIEVEDMKDLQSKKQKYYVVSFNTKQAADDFMKRSLTTHRVNDQTVEVVIQNDLMLLIEAMNHYQITKLDIRSQTLEELFLHNYGGDQ